MKWHEIVFPSRKKEQRQEAQEDISKQERKDGMDDVEEEQRVGEEATGMDILKLCRAARTREHKKHRLRIGNFMHW